MRKPVLQFQDVSFSYGGKKSILDQLNMTVYDREFVTIIGASGSGKSTLFRLITGLEQEETGAVWLNGEQFKSRHGRTGYMPQQDLLMPWRTVLENASVPLELAGISKREAAKRIIPLLDEFGLEGSADKYPSELSGGMRQRVSFLRSVLTGSNILLLDEPFSALDAITRLSMQEWLLDQWEQREKTILFITHDVNEALFLSDRIFIFRDTPVRALEEVAVPLGRPRSQRDLNDPAVIKLKNDLIDQLRNGVKKL
ncbi:ABC transporter ATP-binding protein [Domibacillus sp. DTU_2020_1001157_1_SI_ALB_TIR_016]|uniref:ABC transporter ATP-binding protein n=1 Tax=Domibacillus sp. DTU_2020_1001157_1_SI_ALB_TIR_016 TaxID=3077789 RepID=UPI0028EFD0B0|nr:ABC transporter ATP-binding protein [Domibacillus sp. DTU_2020_1001157_1_SI_ALB_TIR_016]WNS80282.1 ABC transporter ATP-binding protein [Domibacillus sp. DTU_2020_1001157_1_SI_ALB_TIR_016]